MHSSLCMCSLREYTLVLCSWAVKGSGTTRRSVDESYVRHCDVESDSCQAKQQKGWPYCQRETIPLPEGERSKDHPCDEEAEHGRGEGTNLLQQGFGDHQSRSPDDCGEDQGDSSPVQFHSFAKPIPLAPSIHLHALTLVTILHLLTLCYSEDMIC